jgi:uncharacterized membrane protein YraQ (UPF0718 family)
MLLLAIAAPFLAPLLYSVARKKRILLSALDGFLFVAIGGLVLLDVVPALVQNAGWWILLFVLIGFLGPTLIEKVFRSFAKSTHRVAIFLGLISLCIHAMADGAALVEGTSYFGSTGALAWAIVLHRVPVGLTIWWLLRPSFGPVISSSVLGLLAVSTFGGFAFGGYWVANASGQLLSFFQALVAGSLLHVVVHRTEIDKAGDETAVSVRKARLFAAVGSTVAAYLLLSQIDLGFLEETSDGIGFAATFKTLCLESAWPLLIAYVLAGFVSAFMPQASVRWMNKGRLWSQALRGMVIGLPLPVCSCGVVPLFRSLSKMGASSAAALAFLIATPELSLDAVILSFPLLGFRMTMARLVAAAAVALAVGWLLGAIQKQSNRGQPQALDSTPVAEYRRGIQGRLKEALHSGMEVVDHTAPWLLLGLLVAAALEPMLQGGWRESLPAGLEVPIFALLGMPMYVCASGATPLVAVLLFKGVSPGAALAFLLTGPATNVTTFGVISSVLGRKLALLFGLSTAFLSILAGYLLNWVMPQVDSLALTEAAAEPASMIAIISLAVLATLFVVSLFRQGPRGFVGQILFS